MYVYIMYHRDNVQILDTPQLRINLAQSHTFVHFAQVLSQYLP